MSSSEKFWNSLKTQTGKSTIGVIQLGGDFEGIPGEASKLAQGPVYCCATENAVGFVLTPHGEQGENCVKVYWLPWKDREVAVADRKDFEPDCQFFMTAKLEGCRFVLTKDQVLHVAANVSGAKSTIQGSRLRTEAERKVTGGANSRRLSISVELKREGHYKYGNARGGGYAFVFGVNQGDGIWTYKALRRPVGDGDDNWIEFDDNWTTFIG